MNILLSEGRRALKTDPDLGRNVELKAQMENREQASVWRQEEGQPGCQVRKAFQEARDQPCRMLWKG